MRKATITLEGPSIFAGDDTGSKNTAIKVTAGQESSIISYPESVENAAGFFADLFRPLANIGVTISYDELKSRNETVVLNVCIK